MYELKDQMSFGHPKLSISPYAQNFEQEGIAKEALKIVLQ
jgi:hypothetical protein